MAENPQWRTAAIFTQTLGGAEAILELPLAAAAFMTNKMPKSCACHGACNQWPGYSCIPDQGLEMGPSECQIRGRG